MLLKIVSVVCISYNQEKFIKETLQSILSQKTNFDFDVIINDDASSDNTVKIIKEFEKMYPDIIKPIYQTENQYSKNVNPWFDITFPLVKSKYIALCEGDDFWTDENKLQQQFNFMEANPEYSCVLHNSIIVDQNNNFISEFNQYKPQNPIPEKDIIGKGGNLAFTASMFFRNYFEYPDFLKRAKSGDRALRLFLMTKGKFHFIDKKMCAYRLHSSGVTKGGSKTARIPFIESNIELLNDFNIYSNEKYKEIIYDELSKMAKNYAYFTGTISNKYSKHLNFIDKFKIIVYKVIK